MNENREREFYICLRKISFEREEENLRKRGVHLMPLMDDAAFRKYTNTTTFNSFEAIFIGDCLSENGMLNV